MLEAHAAARLELKRRQQAERAQRKQELLEARQRRSQREQVSSVQSDAPAEASEPRAKVSAATRLALQERNDRHLHQRRAAVQAKHKQQTQRQRAQAKLLRQVRVCVMSVMCVAVDLFYDDRVHWSAISQDAGQHQGARGSKPLAAAHCSVSKPGNCHGVGRAVSEGQWIHSARAAESMSLDAVCSLTLWKVLYKP
jgi:hypothetical protein